MTGALLSLIFFKTALCADPRVRRVQVQGDRIVTIRTAIGIATIIQVPDSPNSVVVGDQSTFKVEYLDRAITIKPLTFGAKSNLYVYTDWKRYNVQLISGSEAVETTSSIWKIQSVPPKTTRTGSLGRITKTI